MRTRRRVSPSIVSGYELNPVKGWVAAIIPAGTTNLAKNPSVELATTGHHAVGGVIARVATYQRRGAYALEVTPGAGVNDGWYYDDFDNLVATLQYWGGVDLRAGGGLHYKLYFATNAGVLLGAPIFFTATGRWQRVHVPWREVSTAARRLYLVKDGDANTVPFYLDGVQIENKNFWTTYADGDLPGLIPNFDDFYWTGTPHNSVSIRVGNSAAGGRVINLRDLGFRLISIAGLGLSGLGNQFTPIATGGAVYQGTVITDRTFTLVGDVSTPEWVSLGMTRQALTDLFKPTRVAPQQPTILLYTPCDDDGVQTGDVLEIPCKLDEGLGGQLDNLNQERIGLGFHLYLPFVARETGEVGQALTYQLSLANANRFAFRTPGGVWNVIGSGASSGAVYAFAEGLDGKIYIAGDFASFNGVANTLGICYYDPLDGLIHALGTGGPATTWVQALAIDSLGNIWAVGDFPSMGGVANTANIAYWDTTLLTWVSVGDANNSLSTIVAAYDGSILVGGAATDIGGTPITYAGQYASAAWSDFGAGTFGGFNFPNFLLGTPDGRVYAATNGPALYYRTLADPTWVNTGVTIAGGSINSLLSDLDGALFSFGSYTSLDGDTANRAATRPGVGWVPLSTGLDAAVNGAAATFEGVYIGGPFTTAGGVTPPDGFVLWNRSAFVYVDIDLPGTPTNVREIMRARDGTLYVGHDSGGTALAAYVNTVDNTGTDIAYPRLIFTGPGQLFQLKNWSTNASLWFNLVLLPGEIAVLDFSDPLSVTFTSNFRGNLLSTILPGSSFNFFLQPGVNAIALFVAGTTTVDTAVVLTWRNTHTGIDGAFPNRLIH